MYLEGLHHTAVKRAEKLNHMIFTRVASKLSYAKKVKFNREENNFNEDVHSNRKPFCSCSLCKVYKKKANVKKDIHRLKKMHGNDNYILSDNQVSDIIEKIQLLDLSLKKINEEESNLRFLLNIDLKQEHGKKN